MAPILIGHQGLRAIFGNASTPETRGTMRAREVKLPRGWRRGVLIIWHKPENKTPALA